MAGAVVNDLEMYYEIHGTGRPLVLLHGALTTIDFPPSLLRKSIATISQGLFGGIFFRCPFAVSQRGHSHMTSQ